MKKSFPWIVLAVFVLWLVGSVRSPRQTGFPYEAFGRLPVLLNGRIQPLDSVARNVLLQIRAKQTVALAGGGQMTAIEWLTEVLMNAAKADERPVFRIDNPEVLAMLSLPDTEKYFSFNALSPHLEELDKQAERINQIEAALRTPFEKQVIRLHMAMTLYHRLENSLQASNTQDLAQDIEQFQKLIPEGMAAMRARENKQTYSAEVVTEFMKWLGRYNMMANVAYPLILPPDQTETSRVAFKSVGQALMDLPRGGSAPSALRYYAALSGAYRENKPDAFSRTLTEYQQWLSGRFVPELRKVNLESWYNTIQPFYKAMVLYVVAALLGCFYWFNATESLRRSAYYLLVLALIVHTVGIVFRMLIEGRPPVTNLYSSAVFIGWGAVGLGLCLERVFRDGIGCVVAGAMGFLTQIIAHHLATSGDTMEMLRAVLDTNFWLATHVVTVTLGYSATFVAGFIAMLYILRGFLTRSLTQTTGQTLERMVYGILCFATFFSFVGTVLGGIWADQSWGRFWGWDPKENGALIIVLWNAVILHARWGRLVGDRGLMNLAVFGNTVTSFSWFGVNMLGIGLHAYGFMDEAFKWLILFVVSQLLIIGVGMLPLRWWRSGKALSLGLPTAPFPAKAEATA